VSQPIGPVYRSSGPNRAAAWVVLVGSLVVAVAVNAAAGRATAATEAVAAVCVVVAFLAASSLRFQVRAKPEHLIVCSGGPTRRIPWSQVKGFGVDEHRGRVLYVVLRDGRKRMLPVPEVRAGRITAKEVRDELQRYWKGRRR
jgi:Bacterial PH domain